LNKRHSLLCFLSFWAVLIIPLPSTEAREDTTHLNLRKTAIYDGNTQKYIVQRGDNVDKIIQKFIGDSAHRYFVIKQLNPELKNLNRIYPGQTLVLPVPETEAKETVRPTTAAQDDKAVSYLVKKGDSITRILKRQLHVNEAELLKTLKLVRRMNPDISDLNRIRVGQTILLPAAGIMISSQEIFPSEKQENSDSKKKEDIKPVLPPEKEMNLLKELIGRNHGTMISKGSYFIPLPQMGRMTLDCNVIPIVEFDDGSTALLDFTDRIPKSLQQLIETKWKNYRVVKVRPSQNILLVFQETINASSSYSMKKSLKPIMLEEEPQVLIYLDWLISQKNPSTSKPRFHGILLTADKTQTLPGQIKQYAGQKGFELTEIQNGEFPINSPYVPDSTLLQLPSISADKPLDFIFNLLVQLGYSPLKNQELKLFDSTGDGFNLSVKTDILVKIDQREILISSKKLPQQLLKVLSEQKKEVHVINTPVTKNKALSQILSAVHAPFSFGRYVFYIAGKGPKAKLTITLPAVKIDRKDGPLYLIDYDLDRNLYTLLHDENWKAEIVRY